MANAGHDENHRPTMTALSSIDGVSINRVQANPTNHGIKASNASTGSDVGNNGGNSLPDENMVGTLTAMSSAGDGTIINLYADNSGNLLIKST